MTELSPYLTLLFEFFPRLWLLVEGSETKEMGFSLSLILPETGSSAGSDAWPAGSMGVHREKSYVHRLKKHASVLKLAFF